MRTRLMAAMIFGALGLAPLRVDAQPYLIENATSEDPSAVPLVLLRNQQAGIEAAIAPTRGGELSGLAVRFGGRWIETLFLARDYSQREGWTGRAPLLWPATGRNFPEDLERRSRAGERLDQGAYNFEGKRYPMPIHGFARDLPWRVENKEATSAGSRLTLVVEDTPQTRIWYPFGFRNSVEYFLSGAELRIHYRIQASQENSETMFFSIGNHITFVTPLVEGSDPGDVELITPSSEELLKTEYSIPTGEVKRRSHAAGIKLADFERLKPVSLTGYRDDDAYVLLKDPQGLSIRLSHRASSVPPQPVVLFNLWGDALNGFFSPEPWVGLQNSLVLGQGLTYLAPGEVYDWTITLQVERQE